LNAIIGMTELVLQAELKPLQHEYLTTVLESGESLLSIINEILDFARIEAGKLDLVEVEFDLRETLGDILKSLAFRAHCKNLELAWQVAADVPQFLQGDPVRLRQIIVNLVGNAVKFTQEGEVVVAVECTPHVTGKTVLHVAVSDTGIGIPADKLTLIFEAFEQADSSTTREFGGTGLGLAIASTLVKLMQGHIWVESVEKQGSTFHFTLPLQIVPQPVVPRPMADASSLRGIAVLVVDDNTTNRRILEHTLASWEIEVTCAGGGAEALLLLHQRHQAGRPVRLVLTDINMPKMDGFMLAEEIRRDPALADTWIIALTSGIRADDVERCERTGIAAHLMKPVKQAELQSTLLSVLGSAGAAPRTVRTPGLTEAPADQERRLRILLVEDGLVNRKLAVGLLERRGHVVSVAEDGQLALACLDHETFDVILMDVQMPVMDGLEATREIRQRERLTGAHTPIIAMTAHALKGDRERCLEAGMDGYLAKPVRAKDLYETIEAVLAQLVTGTPAACS
jgi:CheY-like chemotaxis protein